MMYKFTIFIEPQPWMRPVHNRHGIVYNPGKMQRAEDSLAYLASKEIKQPMTGPIDVYIKFWFKRPANRTSKRKTNPPPQPAYRGSNGKKDIDNLCKTVLDAFKNIAYLDDNQVVCLSAEKWVVSGDAGTEQRPRIEVIVKEI
jgi:Holliday junction resolvase RusA-like endonuclease